MYITDKILKLWRTLPFNKQKSDQPADQATASDGRNDDDIRAQFSKMFVAPIADVESENMMGQNVFFKTLAMSAVTILAVGAVSPPIALVVGLGFLIRPFTSREIRSLGQAAETTIGNLKAGQTTNMPSLEAWMVKHADELPEFLNKAERSRDDFLRANRLVARINRAGSTASIKSEDISFLRGQGYRKFNRLPLPEPRQIADGYHLGANACTKISRAVWDDMKRQVRPDTWRGIALSAARRAIQSRRNASRRDLV